MAKGPTPEELSNIDYTPPQTDWMNTPVNFKPGIGCYAQHPQGNLITGY